MTTKIDYRSIPTGFYALDITADADLSATGLIVFERRKNGGLRSSVLGSTPGAAERLRADILNEARSGGADWDQRYLAAIVADLPQARRRYGRFTTKCAWCGRKLTDAASKMRGIGPDCYASLGL